MTLSCLGGGDMFTGEGHHVLSGGGGGGGIEVAAGVTTSVKRNTG